MTEPTTPPPDWRHLLDYPELTDEACSWLNVLLHDGVLHVESRPRHRHDGELLDMQQRLVSVWTQTPPRA